MISKRVGALPPCRELRPTPATLSIPLRIRIIHALSHYFALQQPPHPSPQNRRRVPALPFSTVSLSSPQKTAYAISCSRAPAVIDCMRSLLETGTDTERREKLLAVLRLSPVHSLPLAPATSALASTLAFAAPVHRLQQATASGYSHISFSISELSNSRGFISTLKKHTT
jgi:hypothetical protein